ncbi:MAG: ATP-binding cassette domain-containing protein, partial [Clostridia bacterium]|nr:ATP-binding cassette domain-containing protein [Clostridia bacterium]
MSVLKVTNLVKNYKGVNAIAGLNLTLEEGKIVGLLGPNGSGKTTLIKTVAGLLTADGGSIEVCGNPV